MELISSRAITAIPPTFWNVDLIESIRHQLATRVDEHTEKIVRLVSRQYGQSVPTDELAPFSPQVFDLSSDFVKWRSISEILRNQRFLNAKDTCTAERELRWILAPPEAEYFDATSVGEQVVWSWKSDKSRTEVDSEDIDCSPRTGTTRFRAASVALDGLAEEFGADK